MDIRVVEVKRNEGKVVRVKIWARIYCGLVEAVFTRKKSGKGLEVENSLREGYSFWLMFHPEEIVIPSKVFVRAYSIFNDERREPEKKEKSKQCLQFSLPL